MRSSGHIVHLSSTDHSVGVPDEEKVQSFLLFLNVMDTQVLKHHPSITVLPHIDLREILQILCVGLRVKQVIPLFTIQLEVGDCDFVSGVSGFVDPREGILKDSWDKTSLVVGLTSSHRVGLA